MDRIGVFVMDISPGDIHLSNVLTDHLNNLAYIKAWLLLANKIKQLLLCYTMI